MLSKKVKIDLSNVIQDTGTWKYPRIEFDFIASYIKSIQYDYIGDHYPKFDLKFSYNQTSKKLTVFLESAFIDAVIINYIPDRDEQIAKIVN